MSHLDVLIQNGGGLLFGVWITLLGLRLVGHKPGMNLRYDEWFRRWGWLFKYGGPLLIVGNLAFAIVRLSR